MKSILAQLRLVVSQALSTAFGEQAAGADPMVKAAGDAKFGDYQSNAAMGLAKRLGAKPRDVAQRIIDALPATAREMIEPPDIAGPGFINMSLRRDYLEKTLASIPPEPEADQGAINQSPKRERGVEPVATVRTPVADAQGSDRTQGEPDQNRDRLGIEPVDATARDTVVVDYSSPNVAKQMHVGHLRSTIIGDTIARVLEFEGHAVIRQNHVGDWGTQFGIILEELFERGLFPRGYDPGGFAQFGRLPSDPAELEAIYRTGYAKMQDTAFAKRAREAVTRLQSGQPAERQAWALVAGSSMRGVLAMYDRLGVQMGGADTRGESFYNPLLNAVAEELGAALLGRGGDRAGGDRDEDGRAALPDGRGSDCGGADRLLAVCREDQGALCVFLEKPEGTPAFKGPQGDPLPMIVRKSDGAFLYSTTDIAALAFRINDSESQAIRFATDGLPGALREITGETPVPQSVPLGGLGATRILYVVGSPQKLHFEMLFATVRALGWTRPGDGSREVRLEHVMFGSVLGDDRKMLKTRSGENVKLKDLLDEAVQRAEALVRKTEEDPERRRGFTDEEIRHIAETVGIAAVKYADLCQNRNTDYIFSWDKMLALQGNTAPYMLYAYARIRSIYRKGEEAVSRELSAVSDQSSAGGEPSAILVAHDAERALALCVLRMPEMLDAVAETLLPNILCEYLSDLAGRFMTFYESCPVLKAPDDETKASRMRLCDMTARALKLGLDLLGIKTLDRM